MPFWAPVLGLWIATIASPQVSSATTGQTFWETVGISIASGTVLGASTLPFYERPGLHLANLGYGAAAGAAVGLGVYAFLWMRGSDDDQRDRFSAMQMEPAPQVLPALVMMPVVSLSW